jgi:hypothetical protein
MSAVYSNSSCSPFSGIDERCEIGTYVAYAVNATCKDDVRRTIAFAKQYNIRFVVRNSGHEFVLSTPRSIYRTH